MSKINFTGEIKRELVRNGFENACCKTAALSAFLRVTGSIVRSADGVGFEFVTESESVAEYFIGLAEELFGAELQIVQAGTDRRNGRGRLVFRCLSERSLYILFELGIAERDGGTLSLRFDIGEYLLENECCKRAFVAGAFCGSGSCTLPKEDGSGGYHLEVVFSYPSLAEEYLALLEGFDILAKCVPRKNDHVVYLKSRESISDFLALIGAERSLSSLDALSLQKDRRNRINRIANCMQKNYDKSVLASVSQVQAIEQLEAAGGLDSLDAGLRAVARARLEDKEATLTELAQRLGVSKSCINHRFRKLIKTAEELSEVTHE